MKKVKKLLAALMVATVALTATPRLTDTAVSAAAVSTAALSAVKGLTATPSADKVKLSWKKNSAADGYIIKQYDAEFEEWQTIAKLRKNTSVTYTVSGLSADTKYKFRVIAYKGSKKSKAAGVTVTTKSVSVSAAAVTNFTATDIEANSATLKWDKDGSAEGYKLYRKDGGEWCLIKTITDNSTTACTVNGLRGGTAYDFRVNSFIGASSGSDVLCTVTTATEDTYDEKVCIMCDGNKICSYCEGAKEFSYDFGHGHCHTNVCHQCGGTGYCEYCGGKGTRSELHKGECGHATVGNRADLSAGGTGGAGVGLLTPGKTSCGVCHGDGKVKCSSCDKGFKQCPSCHGAKRYWSSADGRYKNCSRCNGGGQISCGICSGTGYKRCISCGGNGSR